MDFPEVWDFKQRHKTLRLEKFSLTEDFSTRIASKSPATNMVSILLPEVDTSELEEIIGNSDYYKCEDFKLSDVITRSFVEGILKSGVFISVGSQDKELYDTFSICKNKLFLRLHKHSMNSYPSIELSKLQHRLEGEYLNFYIDLLDAKLNLPKLNVELNQLFPASTQIFSWTPNSEDICSSSIAKYFSDAGRTVESISNKLIVKNLYGVKFPQILQDCDEDNFAEISECIAMTLLDCSMQQTDFSSYELPDNCIDIGKGKAVHTKGLINEITIRQLIKEIRGILMRNPSFPWIAMSLIPYTKQPESKLLVISKSSILQFS